MFSSLGLFKQTLCPEHPHCNAKNCLFAHNDVPGCKVDSSTTRKPSETHLLEISDGEGEHDGPRKRRRVSGQIRSEITLPTPSKTTPTATTPPKLAESSQQDSISKSTNDRALPRTASRTISPPPLIIGTENPRKPVTTRHEQRAKGQPTQDNHPASNPPHALKTPTALKAEIVKESLNPRMLPNPPTSHPIRMKLVTMLYEQMVRLNDETKKCQDESRDALVLSDQALITEALDEEFQVARKSSAVYQNVIKSRIMVLKRMKLEVWKEERSKKIAQNVPDAGQKKPSAPKTIETGLTPAEEITFVPRLAAKQEGLGKHGYIMSTPTAAELEAAQKGVESAHGWELCDRCKTRFQIFPGRRAEDGALTSGGSCTYHWAKPRRPDMVKGETKRPDLKYACCDETLGTSTGCTKADSHVFKISDDKRLALVMPFESTPVGDQPDLPGPVCFDCEMGYTTYGMELIRLTATAWPDGRELLDILVHPIGEVLDLNSRFSGVRPEEFANAAPYQKDVQPGVAPTLQIVESPFKARELLFELLTPETPLIGHALENDLNAVRVLHPVIVDTCLLYAHPKGLPLRFGLKALMKRHLDRDIQMGGDQGHDSKEDARAAGDLVRYRIGEMWQRMKDKGWSIRDGDFCPPSQPDTKQE